MGQARQTVERRQLGLTLRRLRKEAGKSQQEAAQAIGKVRSRIVDLEDGRSAAPEEDLVKLLDCYGISGEQREITLALGVEARKRQRRRAYTDLLPGAFQRFADLEASATEISSYESGIIPGLLQSPGYVRSIISAGDGVWWAPSDTELDQRVSFRLARHASVWGEGAPKSLRFVFTEDALHATVGSPEVMHEQHAHILRLVDYNGASVQVLPHGIYQNPALGGGFTVFGFGDKGNPVGFSNVVFGPSTYYHDQTDTETMLRGFDHLCELALSLDQSRALIEKTLEGS